MYTSIRICVNVKIQPMDTYVCIYIYTQYIVKCVYIYTHIYHIQFMYILFTCMTSVCIVIY